MTAVEFIVDELNKEMGLISFVTGTEESYKSAIFSIIERAKEMENEQIGYTESDMRSYASYILNNPVIEPSQWYKIYRTKSE